jgi:type I restriction enzyme R subunit
MLPEDSLTRFSALNLLHTLGWQYLSPEACLQKQGGVARPLLQASLLESLRQRRFQYDGQWHHLSPHAIEQVMRELSFNWQVGNWSQLNKKCHEMLCAGITVTEYLPGDVRHKVTVPIIDWEQRRANLFEVTESLLVAARHGVARREIDLVCYVNGIPLCLILVADSTGLQRGIERHLQHQEADEIPHLYAYSQLLLVLDGKQGVFATNQTRASFWSRWHEEEWGGEHGMRLRQGMGMLENAWFRQLPQAQRRQVKSALLLGNGNGDGGDGADAGDNRHGVSAAEQLLIGLLSPARLLEYLPSCILFDSRNGKLVARSHQFFAVRILLQRLSQCKNGQREGGVVWHTAGSGKSLTMVLLINGLRRHPVLQDCRIVVVTDRLDLEDQLGKKFAQSGAFGEVWRKAGIEKSRAHSAHDLARRIGGHSEQIIFTLLHKFNDALLLAQCQNPSDKVIVLIDEAHRSHGGQLHQRMRRVLKRAALVAFTGTPLLKYEKTVSLFGPILHSYTMQRALDDQMITPLLYEERIPELQLDSAALGTWYEQNMARLDARQRALVRQALSRKSGLYQMAARIEMIAWDIALHFTACIKPVGLKGLVATSSKLDAITYQHYLEQTGLVSSAVIMSAPDGDDTAVAAWWQTNVGARQEEYERAVLHRFATRGELDLLIVVDRLLTGFDQPCISVLYLDKFLQQHGLMQAIARVNRLHDEKRHGLIVDYRGILRPLDIALSAYRELEQAQAWDEEDLQGLYQSVEGQWQRLPALLQVLERSISGDDVARCRQQLLPLYDTASDEVIDARGPQRAAFLQAWREFEQCLRLALGARQVFAAADFSQAALQHYQKRLLFFTELAEAVLRDARPLPGGQRPREELPQPYPLPSLVQALQVRQNRAPYLLTSASAPVQSLPAVATVPVPENEAESGQEMHWSEQRVAYEAGLIHSELTRRITLELDDDPWAQQMLAQTLQRQLSQLQARFATPRQQYGALRELQQQLGARRVAGLPEALRGNPDACGWYGLFLLASGTSDAWQAPPQHEAAWVAQALAMGVWIRDAMQENSLNQAGMEEMIRKRLLLELLPLFLQPGFLTTPQLVRLVEQVLQVVRIRLRKKR